MKLNVFRWVLWMALLAPISVAAQEDLIDPTVVPKAPEKHDLRDGLGWRLGFITSGLFDSGQGRPFFFFDTGLRFKTDNLYFDLKFPALIAGLDFLFFEFQKSVLNANEPFNFFEFLNAPIHYGSYLELSHLRVGQTFALYPFGKDAPLRTTVGLFVLGDFVFFDLALADNRDPEEFDPQNDPNASDPVVIAPGGFIALGGDAPISEYDIAIGAGPDVFVDDSYLQNNGWVLFIDLDLHIDVLEDLAVHLRTRISTYTHTQDPVVTMAVNFGVVLRLW